MDRLIGVAEASKILSMSKARLYNIIKAGLIPAVKAGSYKIRESAIDEFIKGFDGMDISDPFNVVIDERIHSYHAK